jgi:hypothetical protein
MVDFVLGRFLLLLLVVDWAADPARLAPALRALARSQASTENVCPSAGYREDVCRAAAPRPIPAPVRGEVPGPRATPPAAPPPDFPPPGRAPVHRFASIRC